MSRDILWRLAPDVRVEALPESVRRTLNGGEEYAVDRPNSRFSPLAVSPDVRRLLARFHRPETFIGAVLRFARAERADPYDLLEPVRDAVEKLVERDLLVRAAAAAGGGLSAAEPSLPEGTRFKGCVVGRRVRGMVDSEVYFARRLSDGSRCVLKIMRPRHASPAARDGVRRMLRREFEAHERLRGAAVCELLEWGSSRGRVYGVLARVDGPTVVAETRRIGGGPRALTLACRCLEALETIHARNWLHGDVHPGNFLVESSGSVRIVDLGCAQSMDAAGRGARGDLGVIVRYLPPETAARRLARRGRAGWTLEAELYSAAALAYEMISGGRSHLPEKARKDEALAQIGREKPLSFADAGGSPWPEVEAVLRRALSRDPRRRYRSARALREALERAGRRRRRPARGLDVAAFVDERLEALSRERDEPARQNPCLAFGASGAAFALWRAASAREDAALLAEADRWSSAALAEARRPEAFERGLSPAERGRPRGDSVFFGTPGPYLTAALLSWAQGAAGLERAVARLEAHGPAPDAPLELLQGVAGHLAAATCLARETGLPAARALARRWARRLLERPLFPQASARGAGPDIGFAHGVGGVYFALLNWSQACREPLPPEIESDLGMLAGLGRRASRPGWCGGSAGEAMLWAKAFELFRAPAFLETARSSADASLAGAGSLGSVCCGLGGSAYAALALARVDGGRPWRARALTAGRRAIELRRAARWPYGLLKGDAGLVCLGLDLISGDGGGFPLLEG